MRLDEWQKYLDAQFVEDEEPPKAGTSSLGKTVTEKAGDVRKTRLSPLPLDDSAWVVDTPPDHKDPPRPSQIPESARPQPFGEPPTPQADIPPFERYLPPSHAAVQAETSQPVSLPSDNRASTDSVSDPTSDIPMGAFSVLMPMNTYSLRHPAPTTPVVKERQPVKAGMAPRQAPRTRARHARNVRPENVPSGLSAAELWATVPRHVQTLLAMERMEEVEEEVAQSSYKRPFQETRQELIERLLNPILSLEDTARLLNVCPTTVRRYTNRGILTHYRKEPDHPSTGGNSEKETRQRRFRLSDILAFLETQQAAIEADRQAESRRNTIKEAG